MKKSPTLPVVFLGLCLSFVAVEAQELTLAEAFDAEEALAISTKSEELDWPAAPPLPPLEEDNYWHPVTTDTWDGIDALHVRTPFQGAYYANLRVEFEGPTHLTFWSKTSGISFPDTLNYYVFAKGGSPTITQDRLPSDQEWHPRSITIRQQGTFILDINFNKISSGTKEAWLDNLELSADLPPPEIKELPLLVQVPLGKTHVISVRADAVGEPGYQWFLEDTQLDGETQSFVELPMRSEPGTFYYAVEVTDIHGTTKSNPILVEYRDMGNGDHGEGLSWISKTTRAGAVVPTDTQGLADENFWHLSESDAYEGEESVHLITAANDGTSSTLTTEAQGPIHIRFWSKGSGPKNGTGFEYSVRDASDLSLLESGNLSKDAVWKPKDIKIRHNRPLIIEIRFDDISAGGYQAWLDGFVINYEVAPTFHEYPRQYNVPLGKVSKGRVVAEGLTTHSYQWFKDNVALPGQTESTIQFPVETEPQVQTYHVEATDPLGTAKSDPITVNYFDLSKVLDNETLEFAIPDNISGNYSDLLVENDPDPERAEVLYLYKLDSGNLSLINTVESVSTTVEGPVLLSYHQRRIWFKINGETPQNSFSTQLPGDWRKELVVIEDEGPQSITWSTRKSSVLVNYSYAYLDQVELSRTPVIPSIPERQSSIVGLPRGLDYTFVSVGDTTHQLLQGETAILETLNQPMDLADLDAGLSGEFRIRLANEFGEEVISDPFELEIFDTIGEAVEQPNLEWTYEGERIWVPQIFDTWDGEDAAALLDGGEGAGTVSTQVAGPSFVSFYYKKSSAVHINGKPMSLNFSESEWQKAEFVLSAATNELKWSHGLFDRLQIEYVDSIGEAVEQPDLQWTYSGNRIWIPQTEDSYDGEDAARLQTDGSGFGTVSTEVAGPALVSFWWKEGSDFNLNGETITYQGEGWQRVQAIAWSEMNTLQWHSGLFDQLQIEALTDAPFRLWAFSKFPIEDVIHNFVSVQNGDPDFDNFVNLVEWALNKNFEFPNKALAFQLIEVNGEQYLGLTFSRPANLGTYVIHLEASADLTSWERIDSVRSKIFNESNNTYSVTIRDIHPLGTGNRFIRLVVSDE